MVQKNYLSYLISESKKFAKKYKIFDIVLYGSAARGKDEPRDLDILLIFEKEDYDKMLDLAQEFGHILKNKIKEIDVKPINLSELFDTNFLARQGVLLEGVSLLDNSKFSDKLGFESYILFSYNLKKLSHNKKTSYTYALIGRNKSGILKELEAVILGKGVFLIPVKNSFIFENFLEKWGIEYKKKKILVSRL